MCYNGSGAYVAHELSDEQWLDVVQRTIDAGIMEAIVSGGEPLIRGRQFVVRLLELLSDSGVVIHIITNGTFVNRDFVRSLRGLNVRTIQTSIDGPTREIHDAIRGPNFENVITATNLCATHGFACRIGTTIQKLNENVIEDIVELAILLGAQEIVIDQFLPIGRAISNYASLTPTRSHEEIRRQIGELSTTYSQLISVRQGMLCQDQLRQQVGQDLSEAVIIRPNGDMRLGCMAPFTFGNVLEEDFTRLWQSRGARAWHSRKVKEFVASVRDNESLMQEYARLGVVNGFENVTI
jgi:MoaA/NifB/PqqE/SkfB family radical SAM enzyme